MVDVKWSSPTDLTVSGGATYTQADLDAAMIEAEQRGYARAMDAERKLFDAALDRIEADAKRIAELEAALREIAGMDVVSASAVAFNALGEEKT